MSRFCFLDFVVSFKILGPQDALRLLLKFIFSIYPKSNKGTSDPFNHLKTFYILTNLGFV